MKFTEVMKVEVYKIFIKQKFALIFLFVLIVSIIQFQSQHPVSMFNNNDAHKIYNTYVSKYEGLLSHHDINQLKNDSSKILDLYSQYQNLANLKKRQEFVKEHQSIQEKSTVASLINAQVNYISENPNERYFFDPSGWNKLIGLDSVDYLFSILILVFTTHVYTNEHETKVSIFNRSTIYGRFVRYSIQTAIIWISLTLLLLTIKTTKYRLIYKTVGSTSNFSIQSLPSFSSPLFNITIKQTYYLLILIQSIGIFYIVSIISALSQLFKKNTIVLVIGIALVFIPYFLIRHDLISLYPYPVTWLMANQLIQGVHFYSEIVQINSIYWSDFIRVALSTLFIMFSLWLVSFWKEKE